jgi:hypothetical protein
MSSQLVRASPDLLRLHEEGYDIEVRGANLLVRVPYVNADRLVKVGVLVSDLTTSGGTTGPPARARPIFHATTVGEYSTS